MSGKQAWTKPNAFNQYTKNIRQNVQERVGLSNLGATCYVNSLLQILFHLPQFTRQIFAKDSPVCRELQIIFSFLAHSKRSSYNPKHFIEALQLNPQIQQDANEFYRLLQSYLDLDNQGIQVNSVTCLVCGNLSKREQVYNQIELTTSEGNLKAAIDKFCADEKLDGQNQYKCQRCNKLVDAVRGTELKSLPQVLNIQLQRFTLDDSGKDQKAFKFPLTLVRDGLEYDLCSTLLHRGNTAHSGHYVSHVYSKNVWLKCNDEQVVPLKHSRTRFFEFSETDHDELPELEFSDENMFASKSAYMLIYQRRNDFSFDIPMLKSVVLDNEAYQKEADQMNTKLEAAQRNFEVEQKLRFDMQIDKEHGLYVPQQFLREWMQLPPPDPYKVSYGGVMCLHGNLKLNAEVVQIDQGTWNGMCKSGWTFTHKFYQMCQVCQAEVDDKKMFAKEHKAQKDVIEQLIKKGEYTQKQGYDEFNLPENKDGKHKYIPKGFYDQWKKDGTFTDDWSDMVCEHDELHPDEKQRVLVPDSVYRFFSQMHPTKNRSIFGKAAKPCGICSKVYKKEQLQKVELKNQAQDEWLQLRSMSNYENRTVGDKAYLLPTEFVDMWYRYAKSGGQKPDDRFNFICKHGLVNKDEPSTYCRLPSVSTIKQMFPWETSTDESDLYLRNPQKHFKHSQDTKFFAPYIPVTQQEFDSFQVFYPWLEHCSAYTERRSLKLLYAGKDADAFDVLTYVVAPYGKELVVGQGVCFDCFNQERLDWYSESILINRIMDEPLDVMICKATANQYVVHGVHLLESTPKLPVISLLSGSELSDPADSPPLVSSIKPKRKAAMNKTYTRHVVVTSESEIEEIEDTPKKTSRQLQLDFEKKESVDAEHVIAPRKGRMVTNAGYVKMPITRNQTVRDFKVSLMEYFDFTPIQMQLNYHGHQLGDLDQTFADIQLLPPCIIDLVVLPQSDESAVYKDNKDAGFTGTALSSFPPTVHQSRESTPEAAVVIDGNEEQVSLRRTRQRSYAKVLPEKHKRFKK